MALSNYPPGVSGNEPQIIGEDAEKLYLVCACGEAFDELGIARQHVDDAKFFSDCGSNEFSVVPESEAF
jgi:hypothetical protein